MYKNIHTLDVELLCLIGINQTEIHFKQPEANLGLLWLLYSCPPFGRSFVLIMLGRGNDVVGYLFGNRHQQIVYKFFSATTSEGLS